MHAVGRAATVESLFALPRPSHTMCRCQGQLSPPKRSVSSFGFVRWDATCKEAKIGVEGTTLHLHFVVFSVSRRILLGCHGPQPLVVRRWRALVARCAGIAKGGNTSKKHGHIYLEVGANSYSYLEIRSSYLLCFACLPEGEAT